MAAAHSVRGRPVHIGAHNGPLTGTSELEQIVRKLENGTTLIKFDQKGRPEKRRFSVKVETRQLFWSREGPNGRFIDEGSCEYTLLLFTFLRASPVLWVRASRRAVSCVKSVSVPTACADPFSSRFRVDIACMPAPRQHRPIGESPPKRFSGVCDRVVSSSPLCFVAPPHSNPDDNWMEREISSPVNSNR